MLLQTNIEPGESKTTEDFLPQVYEELRKLAGAKMAAQSPDHTLQPTALAHEAYLRLRHSGRGDWKDSRHFLATAAAAMRQILVDSARKKQRIKRGGEWQRLNLDDVQIGSETPPDHLLALNDALEQFAIEYPEKAELVKLCYFTGLPLPQAAQAMDISLATAKRQWSFSKAWLYRHITKQR